MNQCVFIGRLVADPEGRTTASGIANATFRIAVQRRFKNANGEREADFITCVAWRGTADYVTKYLQKGDMVGVQGSMQNRSYEAQDGSKRYVTEIIVDNVESCGGASKQAQTDEQGFMEVPDEPLPF